MVYISILNPFLTHFLRSTIQNKQSTSLLPAIIIKALFSMYILRNALSTTQTVLLVETNIKTE